MYDNFPDYCKWTLQTVNFDRGSARESTMAMRHFARYLYRMNTQRAPLLGEGAPPSTSNGPMAVHLPAAEARTRTKKGSQTRGESPTDRRRTFAEASAAHDAAGDAAMATSGQDGWEFPQEQSPGPFRG